MPRILFLTALAAAAGCGGGADSAEGGADSGPVEAADSGGGETGGGETGGGETGDDTGGAGSAGTDTGDFCDGIPAVTYNNFGAGFMTENCQGCHASTATNRYGAPEDIVFDTVDDCWIWADRILARCTGEAPTMPPQGGVSDDDRTKLEWWLRCTTDGS